MIHCYFGDYSSHQNEVKMLNQFLSQLQLDWSTADDWIYIIFNAMWNGEEIDLVCFTRHAIIVADLKNYSGQLIGGENGSWKINTGTETIEVKGGGQINPYVQIRKNKFSVINWIKNNNFFSNSHVDHVTALLIFNELESCQIDAPPKVQRWLQVSDIPHSSGDLSKLHNPQIQLDESEVQALIQKMKLQSYQWQAGKIADIRFHPFQQHTADSSTSHRSTKFPTTPLYTAKPPSKWQEVFVPFLLTITLAYGAGYYFLYKDQNTDDFASTFATKFGLMDNTSEETETVIQPAISNESFQLGMSYREVADQAHNIEKVTSHNFSNKIVQITDKNLQDQRIYLFFSADDRVIGIRYMMDNPREGIDQRYDQFKKLKKQYKQQGYTYLSGDEPFVGTQVANFKDKKTNTYYQVFQPHLSFSINTLTMTEDFYQQYAKAASQNNRGEI